MKKIIFLICCFIFTISINSQTVEISHIGNVLFHSPRGNTDICLGQSFTATITGRITKISFVSNTSFTANLSVFSGEGTSGFLLHSQVVNVTNTWTNSANFSFTEVLLSTPINITNSSKYTFSICVNDSSLGFWLTSGDSYSGGVMYSNSNPRNNYDLTFKITQEGNAPAITTTDANSITKNSASLGGNITSNNGYAITERGVVYSSTDTQPEIGDPGVSKEIEGGTSTGAFSETISGLSKGTTYYYRAYAMNSQGTNYGEVKSFTTKDPPAITSIVRQNPTTEQTTTNEVSFRITFDKAVNNVDTSDFTTESSSAIISNVSQITPSIYDVTVNNITQLGVVSLQTKGINGVSGSNDITHTVLEETTTINQQNTNDYLTQSIIGQTFTASTNGVVKWVTFYPLSEQHSFSGTADLKLYSGNRLSGTSLSGGTEIDSESISVTNSTNSTGQTFSFSTPVNLTAGQTYTITLENFTGNGSHALESHTSNQYNGGHAVFLGMNNTSHLNLDLKIRIIEGVPGTENLPLFDQLPGTNEKFLRIDQTGKPVVSTADASNINATGANLGGEAIAEGNSAITERGIVYSTTDSHPRIGKAGVIKNENGTGTGSFSETITGLSTNNTYFYRAYATNSQGTRYGSVKRFNFNNSLHFSNATGNRITIADHSALDFSGGFTAEAWIKADVLATRNILSQYSSSDRAFSIFLLNNGRFEFTANPSGNGSSEQFFVSTNASINTGVWHHIAATYDGTTMRVYVDGVASGSEGHSGSLYDSSEPLEIGSRNNNHFFDGAIDEVRIWGRALSASEISNYMNKQLPSNVNGLIAYYKMNQGVAEGNNSGITQLTDSGPNNLHGIIENFTLNTDNSNFVDGVNGGNIDMTNFAPNMFTSTGNWSNTGNWSHGNVPSNIHNATIADGITVTIDVDDLNINDFNLNTGAILTIPKDKEITVNGAFSSSGALELQSDKSDSGVLFLRGNSSGTVTYKRGGLIANKWSIVTPPVSGQTVKSFAENAANDIRINTTPDPDRYAIGYYDDSQAVGSKWQYYDANVSSSIEFTPGQSYAISRNTDGEITFTGTLTSDNVFKTLIANQWNAIGNPFTTYYPANKNSNSSFLNDNSSALDPVFQSLYLWDNTQNKYVAVSELDAADRSLPPGQGFFVRMATGQTEINFQEEKRTTKPSTGTTDFSRTIEAGEIDLFLSDGNTEVKTQIKYFDHTTFGFDTGFDIGNFDGSELDIYTKLVDEDLENNFTIQSLPLNSFEDTEIPVGVSASQGTQLSFKAIVKNIPNEISVYLEDREIGTFTQLNETEAKYDVSLTSDLEGIGRFFIHTTSNSLSNSAYMDLSHISIFNHQRSITIANIRGENIKAQIYSLVGKELLNKKFVDQNTINIPVSELSTGIYIVKVTTKRGQLTKKILIN